MQVPSPNIGTSTPLSLMENCLVVSTVKSLELNLGVLGEHKHTRRQQKLLQVTEGNSTHLTSRKRTCNEEGKVERDGVQKKQRTKQSDMMNTQRPTAKAAQQPYRHQ